VTKKVVYKIIIGIILYFILSTVFKLYKNSVISDTCLSNTFKTNFSDLSSFEINSTYDFEDIFECQNWDEIFIVDAVYYSRGIGYLRSGILVPSSDINEYPEGTYLVYFLKNNIVISNPNPLFDSNFILSLDNNIIQYLRINKKNAKFIYQKFEHSDFDYNTLELIKD
jgi:hypothetical protein